MRIVASVQAKRGSSRGLVHYIAHSKLDAEREPGNARAIFNTFADNLSVTSANNSMRVGVAKGRPSNEELHHLVLSFRPEDFRKLGESKKQRCRAVKEVTRAAMRRLEGALSADRLSWAAAVHLNTDNPHVHIALQKQFFTRDLERETLTKIPREALPHFELRGEEKVLAQGFLIEAATDKLDLLIARYHEQSQDRDNDRDRDGYESHLPAGTEWEKDRMVSQKTLGEREILRRGIIAAAELRRIDSRINVLIDHGDKLRFRVSDPVSGRKVRLSLKDLEQRATASPDAQQAVSPERQIRTVLLKMLGKAEAERKRIRNAAADTIREADAVRSSYRKMGRKLPVPSFTKDELDKLQEYCRGAGDIRRFVYLEGVRSKLELSREIGPRSKDDLRGIAAQKMISDLTIRSLEKDRSDFIDRQYYQFVDVGGRHASLAQIDREKNTSRNPILSLVEKVKDAASRLSGRKRETGRETQNALLRNDVLGRLDEKLAKIEGDMKTERNRAKMLEKVLQVDTEKPDVEPRYSAEQLAEIEALSLRLKLQPIYERNWDEQRTHIEAATNDSPAARKLFRTDQDASLSEHKTGLIAGRALAREIVAKAEFDKAREDLNVFTESKRFQKFAIANKDTGTPRFVSLHDVDLPKRGSLLDRTLDEVFESREHRSLRRSVSSLVNARERTLREDVAAAREIMVSASRNASEFKQFSLFGLQNSSSYQPMFTSSEARLLEARAANTRDPKEAARLRNALDLASDRSTSSLKDILRAFENPDMIPTGDKEHLLDRLEATSPAQTSIPYDRSGDALGKMRSTDQGHSR